ncbi:MAG: NAD(P)-dependent dehydrogenase (short-subunit alcohol dehydrogenase family) [Alcanivorax sp.]|jgi:NAD(P)-dependent dehydrogenase (short-subunit alcohol dehydrogenase family)
MGKRMRDKLVLLSTPTLTGLPPEEDNSVKASIPMRIIGDPKDIAYGSFHLCSEEARYVFGIELHTDAFWTA